MDEKSMRRLLWLMVVHGPVTVTILNQVVV